MSSSHHTYGPTCRLKIDPIPQEQEAEDRPPHLRAQFFYTSAVPIDDPLSPLPPPSNTPTSTVLRHPSRPFSALDNAALEEAWKGLYAVQSKYGSNASDLNDIEPDLAGSGADEEATSIGIDPAADRQSGTDQRSHSGQIPSKNAQIDSIGPDSHTDVKTDVDNVKDLKAIRGLSSSVERTASPYGASPGDKDTTGTPFLRAPARSDRPQSSTPSVSSSVQRDGGWARPGSSSSAAQRRNEEARHHVSETRETSDFDSSTLGAPTTKPAQSLARVPVGISRLHLVDFPELMMKPIYWSPVNDISSVVRGTWFYKETMTPVEAEVANQLEAGFLELKPWTETWKDELNSAVSFGAEGERMVPHKIWPEEEDSRSTAHGKSASSSFGQQQDTSRLKDKRQSNALSSEPPLMSKSADGANADRRPGVSDESKSDPNRPYATSSVIYINEREAFILRPNLLPSVYYGRRPLARLRKGLSVGVAVIRGFDWDLWLKIHPPRRSKAKAKAEEGAIASRSGTAESEQSNICSACFGEGQPQNVTDLILIIHGVGQKLSERIESYNFTHAINSFRRLIHVGLGDDHIKSVLRSDVGGMMALPINWRSTLSFEEGGPPQDDDDSTKNDYGLKDITPQTIPAIRNLISDVMLDIPYYLSHHKPKMIRAVIREANRVYRLWCKNNPGFERNGQVHLIAHSLGSVMALDILSNQPTQLPQEIHLSGLELNDKYFDFDTKNIFMCGSPAGFFLLLNRAPLLPRRGRNKPGAEDEDIGKDVAGEAGTYGCLAVDNIYNVLNYNDPIAYKLTGTVDAAYAASLRPAAVPSSSPSLLSSLSGAFKTISPYTTAAQSSSAATKAAAASAVGLQKPDMTRLPTTVEMDTHNFTREELAEKRAYLLNENGQIDWFLSSSGGPLEIQYLNMLGAHSSYWVSRDFVRFLVVEIGRTRGRVGTLDGVRAHKKGFGK
ncbi:MAG: hypothetical protein M1825_000375 [Sarcosagium campestre]|nr:MAG: hypothetical protein M1825_000375 [Sarcosagium campestre]